MALRIRDWDRLFENSTSRKLKRLDWVAIPNKTDGEGYMELVDHPDGAAHLGAWYAIVECASKQKIRGNLPGISQDVGGICRAVSRISQLPADVFLDVVPRLLKIGWLEEYNEQQNQVVTESPTSSVENPSMLGENPTHREGKGITGKGRTQQGSAAALAVVRADRFAEFIAPWPRDAHPDQTARMWISCVETEADEGLAFIARDRYLASDEVARGVITEPARWLQEQKSAKWGGKWPPAVARHQNGSASTIDRAMSLIQKRIARGERPI